MCGRTLFVFPGEILFPVPSPAEMPPPRPRVASTAAGARSCPAHASTRDGCSRPVRPSRHGVDVGGGSRGARHRRRARVVSPRLVRLPRWGRARVCCDARIGASRGRARARASPRRDAHLRRRGRGGRLEAGEGRGRRSARDRRRRIVRSRADHHQRPRDEPPGHPAAHEEHSGGPRPERGEDGGGHGGRPHERHLLRHRRRRRARGRPVRPREHREGGRRRPQRALSQIQRRVAPRGQRSEPQPPRREQAQAEGPPVLTHGQLHQERRPQRAELHREPRRVHPRAVPLPLRRLRGVPGAATEPERFAIRVFAAARSSPTPASVLTFARAAPSSHRKSLSPPPFRE